MKSILFFYGAIKTQERALISKNDDLEMTEILLKSCFGLKWLINDDFDLGFAFL